MKIWCLHGAMQTSSVWDGFDGKFCISGKPALLQKVNLYREISTSLVQWAQDFCLTVSKESAAEKPFLLGYSLGGRLAMHAYLNAPDMWRGMIIVSADPGASSNEQKKQLLKKDLLWSERFQCEDLKSLLEEWDGAAVFCKRLNQAPRILDQLDPQKISKLLSVYSKGGQQDLMTLLHLKGKAPMLFLSGEEDSKYSEIGKRLQRCCPQLSHGIIRDAGHRVPWENTKGFISAVNLFLDSTMDGQK
ncbi:MAG: alpha/beta fold hydrolase [Opitutales bacterium]|nr:alpha/beta fold hydrolase [Opitutales bacterium]